MLPLLESGRGPRTGRGDVSARPEAEAYDRFAAGGKLGKIVLLPAGD